MNDNIAEQIQEQLFNEIRKAYGEKGFERWCNLRYNYKMKYADVHAKVKGKCGDTMEIFLKFKKERVYEASYCTDGCASSNLCGSFAAELALGKNCEELTEITGERILQEIGTFPREQEHCAFLAAETLQEAVNDYMIYTCNLQ